MRESILILLLALALAWPLGQYLALIFRRAPSRLDRWFAPIEGPLYRLLGINPDSAMSWRGYALAFLFSNALLAVPAWLILMTQAWLPLNPDAVPNMQWDTALHTMVSFLTNTNQQHYSGQAQLSYLAQMVVITGLQIATPMMGLVIAVATLRAMFAPAVETTAKSDEHSHATPVAVGNYWVDLIRASTRLMLPLCLIWAVLLGAEGVPATLSAGPVATTLDAGSGQTEQKVPLGPVAPMVAAKQLGTNGGGWYGPNSSMPLENPTPLSNFLETLAIVLLPMAVVMMIGPLTGRRRFGALVFGCMATLSVASVGLALWAETASVPATQSMLMEGKEVRFGAEASALWASLTTQTSNGSVNAMHDSLAPLTGLVTISNMLINAIWGGVGCGMQQFLVYLLLTVFLAGLMTGRSPELFGRKIEAPEIRWLAWLVLLQPIVVLGFTAIALANPEWTGNSNPGFHGISQVYYEYTSAFANNGSGFEGLGDATIWWNLSTTLALLLGRYPALLIPLIVAARLAAKPRVPEGPGTLSIETPTFALTTIAIIVILTLLQFMPALVLGPVAEHLSLSAA